MTDNDTQEFEYRFITEDGFEFTQSKKTLESKYGSNTLFNYISDIVCDENIVSPVIAPANAIKEYLRYQNMRKGIGDFPFPLPSKPGNDDEDTPEIADKDDLEFMMSMIIPKNDGINDYVDGTEIINFMRTMDYIDNNHLMNLCAKYLAMLAKKLPVPELRKCWGVVNDFTPEEEAE